MSYRWYYTDVAAGEWSVVVIFMSSPVFSPRRRAAAVNVAAYRAGRRVYWAFSEYNQLSHLGSALGVGDSWLRLSDDGVEIEVHEQAPFASQRIDLTARLWPLSARGPQLTLRGSHRWQCLMPRAHATARINGVDLQGLGYHDTNWGDVALGRDLGHWTWTRAHEAERTWIHYWVGGESEAHLLLADASGVRASRRALSRPTFRRSAWGLLLPSSVGNGEASFDTGALIESSPFYARLQAGERLTEVAHFARSRWPAFCWMPYFRSRAEAA